jgi:hypothetical protein
MPAVLVMLAVLASSCSVPGTWKVIEPVTRGSTPATIRIASLSCGSPTNCVGLPVFNQGPMPEPPGYGEAWDGTSWKPVPAPALNLYGLSCSGEWCLAIARPSTEPGSRTRAWAWEGEAWTEVDDLDQLVVSSVDCFSADHCVAIGSTNGNEATAAHWDGQGWTTISDSRPAATWMSQVQCLADDSCVFVTDGNGDGMAYEFERWDGSGWSDMPQQGTQPSAIDFSCGPTLPTCMFAGTWTDGPGDGRSAFVRWDGASWRPDPFDPVEYVDAVSCQTDGTCVAVTNRQTLVFDGSSWSSTGDAPPPAADLTCGSATTCFSREVTLGPEPLVPPGFFRWDGAGWSEAPVEPNPTISDAALSGVSCPTTTWCMAVGEYKEGSATLPLVERWDGSAWSLGPDLAPAAGLAVRLRAVSCPAPDDCVAVGSATPDGGQPGVFVARWDGSSWTDESASAATASPVGLNDVSCVGATCVAVGNGSNSIAAIRSDGDGWTALPPPPGAPVIFNGRNAAQVSCASATWCGLTSLTFMGGGPASNLSVWDGTTWSVPADTGGFFTAAVLFDVACPAPGHCLAVGASLSSDSGLSATWTGSAWVTQEVPVRLGSVSCARPDRCLGASGAGDIAGGGAAQLARAQVWDGSSWRQVRPGAPEVSSEAIVADLSCVVRRCVLVGYGASDPLAYRFSL